jgi:two-component system, sensor histidine kinase and response regulator
VEVQDSGIGIPADRQSAIFESFTQADGSTTRKYGGTGLGLTISKQLITLMGGEINLYSVEGRGSTFFFELDLPVLMESPNTLDQSALRDLRVLAVDDHPVNLRILRDQLGTWGCEVTCASSAAEALEILEGSDEYDVALVDYQMPEMHGGQLVGAIRRMSTRREIAIVMLSSVGASPAELGPERPSIDAYLMKPIRQALLYSTLLSVKGKSAATPAEQAPAADALVIPADIRALLVEDNPINQKVAQQMLRKFGVPVDVANDGLEALELLRAGSYTIVFMDLQMPRMDGIEATQAWRADEGDSARQLPIIAMTANAMPGDRERCLAAGMNDYLSKPVRPTELMEMLRKWTTVEVTPQMESQESLSEARVLNLERLSESCGGDPDFERELLNEFLQSMPHMTREISDALLSGNLTGAADIAHKLKGGSKAVGAERLALLCERLEGQRNGSQATAEEIFAKLGREAEAIASYAAALGRLAA